MHGSNVAEGSQALRWLRQQPGVCLGATWPSKHDQAVHKKTGAAGAQQSGSARSQLWTQAVHTPGPAPAHLCLAQGLALFQGGVLMVSHDQHLIESTVDELWAVEGGRGEGHCTASLLQLPCWLQHPRVHAGPRRGWGSLAAAVLQVECGHRAARAVVAVACVLSCRCTTVRGGSAHVWAFPVLLFSPQ